jgi:very-short-patch-repair endonuclease
MARQPFVCRADNKGMAVQLARCRQLRHRSTDAEAALWSHLRSRRMGGFKFRRRYPCGPFILDFFCPVRRLAIELDGGQHFEASVAAHDARRRRVLATRGISVLRFAADQIFRETDAVLMTIAFALGAYVADR